jgi:dihydroxyacid dehydratase/phosphogluconate dehydratase
MPPGCASRPSRTGAAINAVVPRLVDVLPNGPVGHPTVRVFLAGGVPEVMLNLRDLGLLRLDALTVHGRPLGEMLDIWQASERRRMLRASAEDRRHRPRRRDHGAGAGAAARADQHCHLSRGNLAPEGSVVKSTSIDPRVLDADGVYRKVGPARVFTSEVAAIAAIKGHDAAQTGAAPATSSC